MSSSPKKGGPFGDSPSLFADVRETLETLGSEAFNQDDLTGGEMANDALRALAAIEDGVRRIAEMPLGASQAVAIARRLIA